MHRRLLLATLLLIAPRAAAAWAIVKSFTKSFRTHFVNCVTI